MHINDNGKHGYKVSVGSHFNLVQRMTAAFRDRLLAVEQRGLMAKLLLYLYIHKDKLAQCHPGTEKQ